MLQKPETKKNPKYQRVDRLYSGDEPNGGCVSAGDNSENVARESTGVAVSSKDDPDCSKDSDTAGARLSYAAPGKILGYGAASGCMVLNDRPAPPAILGKASRSLPPFSLRGNGATRGPGLAPR